MFYLSIKVPLKNIISTTPYRNFATVFSTFWVYYRHWYLTRAIMYMILFKIGCYENFCYAIKT